MTGQHCQRLREVVCILVYDESCGGKVDWPHTLLNHALVAVNTASVVSLLRTTKDPGIIDRNAGGASGPSVPGIGASILGFSFGTLPPQLLSVGDLATSYSLVANEVIAFQIVLCLALGCVGVSIVWCAEMGWVLKMRGTEAGWKKQVLCVDVGALLFYAFASEPITTVAHVAAIALGQAVWGICVWAERRKSSKLKQAMGE